MDLLEHPRDSLHQLQELTGSHTSACPEYDQLQMQALRGRVMPALRHIGAPSSALTAVQQQWERDGEQLAVTH